MFTATIFTGQPGPQRCSLYLILYIFWLMKHLIWRKAVNTCLLDLVLLFFFLLPPAVGSINLLCHMLDIHCILYYTRVAQLSNLCGFLCSQRMRHRIILRQSPERYKMYKHHHQCHSQGWHRSQPLPPFNSIFVIIIIFIYSFGALLLSLCFETPATNQPASKTGRKKLCAKTDPGFCQKF